MRASVDKAQLLSHLGTTDVLDDAERALEMARELGDPSLTARALTACGMIGAATDPKLARQYYTEAASLAQNLSDFRLLGQIRAWETISGLIPPRG